MSGSSTPFVTGRPFTFFHNGKVQSSGAVGLALPFSPTATCLSYKDLVKLTPSLPVVRAEGNLIHEIGDSLPARVLVKAIQDHGLPDDLAKNVDYYIGVRDAGRDDMVTVRNTAWWIVADSDKFVAEVVEDHCRKPIKRLDRCRGRRCSCTRNKHRGKLSVDVRL